MERGMIIVVGAGVSGLAAAGELSRRGLKYKIIERCPEVGGLTRTVKVDKFKFDYTGHFLHLAKYRSVEDIPGANLKQSDWQRVQRKAVCHVAGAMVPAPIQYNLRKLPKNIFEKCMKSYDGRPVMSAGDGSFRSYLVGGFGDWLANNFLIPQNEKTQAISLEELSPNALGRFFPKPDDEKIRVGLEGTDGGQYNSEFFYPVGGGIEALVKGLAEAAGPVLCNTEIVHIDLNSRVAIDANGYAFEFESLLSSMPLKDLCRIVDDQELQNWGKELSNSSTICFNFGVKGQPSDAIGDAHWIYIPDPQVCFYRVGCYSNIDSAMASQECHSLYVEVGVSLARNDIEHLTNSMREEVLYQLNELGLVDRSKVECELIYTIDCAYVHMTPRREELVPQIRKKLANFYIYPIGRYGLWDYCGMEDSILSGIQAAAKL
jgi:protoporphyrinogen oxidase